MPTNHLSVPYPIYQPVANSHLKAVVDHVIEQHPHVKFPDIRATRAALTSWLNQSQTKFSPGSPLIDAIYKWFRDCIHLDLNPKILAPHNAVDFFWSIKAEAAQDKPEVVIAELLFLQTYVAKKLGMRQHDPTSTEEQACLLHARDEDLTDLITHNDTDTEDMLDDVMDTIQPDEPDMTPDEPVKCDVQPNKRHEKQSKKQPKKRPSIEVKDFLPLCSSWHRALQGILTLPVTLISPANPIDPPDLTLRLEKVIDALRSMKKITKRIYFREEFLHAVGESKLAADILEVSHPAFYIKYNNPHNERLVRVHALGIAFARILDKWSENMYAMYESPDLKDYPDIHPDDSKKEFKNMDGGKELMAALRKYPALIPTAGNPTSVFFLCSLGNFVSAWNRWLKWHLSALRFKVTDKDPAALYKNTMSYISQVQRRTVEGERTWIEAIADDVLGTIIRRTLKFKKLKKNYRSRLRRGRQKDSCDRCRDLPAGQQCRSTIQVVREPDEHYLASMRGVGVTLVPEGERMLPTGVGDSENGKGPIIMSANGLQRIAAQDEILERCERQIIHIEEESRPGQIIDFVFYDAFPPSDLEMLISHHNTSSGVRPLTRGSQFKFWSSGAMFPFGSRMATGGNEADGYVEYAGITAETVDGIEVLFNQAESSLMLSEVARLVDDKFAADLDEAGALCDHVGVSGANLYTCDDYAAPLHCDDDAVRSLSCQLVKNVHTEYDEYGFANLAYGYYIATRANMAWSFDANEVHGTILPSQKTLDDVKTIIRLRGGASKGNHKTVTSKNKKRAEDDHNVRHNYNLRRRAWGS
ncbi:hypothetical protein PM082_020475 [Marasmius tenuissimus]|nr:hypothetical protein PM082_020475 [Marasmius tenuissimus]